MSNGENDQHAGSNPAKRTIPKLLVLLKNVGKLLGMKSVTELRGGADCTARLTLHQQSGGFVSEKPVCTWLRENVLRRHSGANGISGALLPKHLHWPPARIPGADFQEVVTEHKHCGHISGIPRELDEFLLEDGLVSGPAVADGSIELVAYQVDGGSRVAYPIDELREMGVEHGWKPVDGSDLRFDQAETIEEDLIRLLFDAGLAMR
jgi:hypothetical protein